MKHFSPASFFHCFVFVSFFLCFFQSKSWSLRWLWEFRVNANATHRSKGYKSLINPFIAFNTKRGKEACVPVSSLIGDTTYSAICSFDEISVLAIYPFGKMTIRQFVRPVDGERRFADWTTVLSVLRSFHSIFFFTPVINSFTFHPLVFSRSRLINCERIT